MFSMGVTCFEITTRCFPFAGLSQPEIVKKLSEAFEFDQDLQNEFGMGFEQQSTRWAKKNPLAARRPDLSLVEPGCPKPLVYLMKNCWADAPTELPSLDAFIDTLSTYEREVLAETERKQVAEKQHKGSAAMATSQEEYFADTLAKTPWPRPLPIYDTLRKGHAEARAKQLAIESAAKAAGTQPQIDLGILGVQPDAERLWNLAHLSKGSTDQMRRQLDIGAPIDWSKGFDSDSGYTSLHIACVSGNEGAARLLLSRGAQIDAETFTFHRTPLIIAAIRGRPALVRVLLAAGANPARIDDHNCDAMYYAKQRGTDANWIPPGSGSVEDYKECMALLAPVTDSTHRTLGHPPTVGKGSRR